jgi:hypothetical protein
MKFNLKSFRLGNFLSKRINTILLIVILIIILTGHVVCSCSKMTVTKVVEKISNMGKDSSNKPPLKKDLIKHVVANKVKNHGSAPASSTAPTASSSAKPATTTTTKPASAANAMKIKIEGFTGANTNYGQSAPYLLGSQSGTVALDTNSWNQPDLVVKCDGSYGKGVADILGRQKQPIPLPEGELDMFATTPFKPECCPNFYSNSTGCACMATDQYNYLQTRGGNNVPYSEY